MALPSTEEIVRLMDAVMENGYVPSEHREGTQEQLQLLQEQRVVSSEWVICSDRPFIGRLICLAKRILRKLLHAYIQPMVERQNAFNESSYKTTEQLYAYACDLEERVSEQSDEIRRLRSLLLELRQSSFKEIETLRAEIGAGEKRSHALRMDFEKGLWTIRNEQRALGNLFDDLRDNHQKFDDSLSCLRSDYQELANDLRDNHQKFDDSLSHLRSNYQELANDLRDNHQKFDDSLSHLRSNYQELANDLRDNHQKLDDSLSHLHSNYQELDSREETLRSGFRELCDCVLPPETGAFDYLGFENRFRGDRAEILQRQSIYLDIFRGRENILDIGCGRGEFVELLLREGIRVVGVDSSAASVAECRKLELPVVEQDIFEYLSQRQDHSVGGVFCSQVIEHLSARKIVKLIKLLKKKLYIGAPVVFETINPLNLQAVNNWFYMDVTHVRPVHPETLAFILESNGFSRSDVLWLHSEESRALPELPSAGEFNEKLCGVNRALFGPQDYGIVAYNLAEEV